MWAIGIGYLQTEQTVELDRPGHVVRDDLHDDACTDTFIPPRVGGGNGHVVNESDTVDCNPAPPIANDRQTIRHLGALADTAAHE